MIKSSCIGASLAELSLTYKTTEAEANGVTQIVNFGAGLDFTQALTTGKSINLFEVDRAGTIGFKQMLSKDPKFIKYLGLEEANAFENYSGLAVDFEQVTYPEIFNQLERGGYNKNEKSSIIIEGVTMYLTRDNIKEMLDSIWDNTAPDSQVSIGVLNERYLTLFNNSPQGIALDESGVSLKFGADYENFASLCAECGFSVEEYSDYHQFQEPLDQLFEKPISPAAKELGGEQFFLLKREREKGLIVGAKEGGPKPFVTISHPVRSVIDRVKDAKHF